MRNIVTVSSKGGVGKSIFSVTLAYAISKLGHRAALLDSDISMPAITKYLNMDNVEVETRKTIEPIQHDGIEVFSPGFIMDKDQPVVITASKREAIVRQMLDTTDWHAEYLVIDTPPGATDELKHLLRTHPETLMGVFVVTTPSEVAITQVRRSMELMRRLKIPILGVVCNMANIECEKCHHVANLFTNGKANPVDVMAADFKTKVVARFPLYPRIDEEPKHFVDYLAKELKNGRLF
jgi:ATP-binding protein involved in chromosome partitioning